MERKTFERALHTWDNWNDSIERSRKLLGFNVGWPINIRRGLIKKRYPEIREQAEAELKRLNLPTTLREYWEDCFYSDYRNRDGKSDYSKITRCLSKRKSLPQLPCDHGVVWYEHEDIHNPWIRVEIRLHARFATKELFNYAAKYAYQSLESYLWSENVHPHPLCQWLSGGRPPVGEKLALECARLRDEEKWSERAIGKHFGWALQEDSYGNLIQCRTARRYVSMGRELKKKART